MDIFVSTIGNDTNKGTIESPLATFEGARDFIRNNHILGDIFVYLREGRYFRKSSFELNEKDSASGNCKTVYTAYENEKVFIDGGIVIEADKVKKVTDQKVLSRIIEETAREHLYEIDLSEYKIDFCEYGNRGFRRAYIPSPNELFINSNPQIVARYPNVGADLLPLKNVIDSGSIPYQAEFDMRGGVFNYDIERGDLWENAENAYVSGLFAWCYADDTIKIDKIDTKNKTIKTMLPHLAGFKAEIFTKWCIINLLEEIDVEGEYYIDINAEKLYFYPPKSVENALIQLSILDQPMVVMQNVTNVLFSNMTFENARGTGIYIEGGDSCCVNNCTFRNLGMVAVQIGQGATSLPEGMHTAHGIQAEGIGSPKGETRMIGSWHEMIYQFAAWNNHGGKNHSIVNCEIYNTGTGGILLGGGDRKSLIPANNRVHNCRIHHVNRLDKTYKAGVNISGVGNIISNCEISDMPGFGIYLHGNDHIIEYNKIHHVIQDVTDAGAIYMGRDISEVGNVFRYNFIYDINGNSKSEFGVCAIYFDDYSSFNEVYGNYFYNVKAEHCNMNFGTVFWNRGGQTSVSNNIFIHCAVAIQPQFNGARGLYDLMQSDKMAIERTLAKDENNFSGVDITSEAYRKKYPYLYEVYLGTYKNELMYWNNVVITNGLDGFADPDKLDFTVLPTFTQITKAEMVNIVDIIRGVDNENRVFEVTDFSKIGVH